MNTLNITASDLIALLTSDTGPSADEKYKVAEPIILKSDMTLHGNGTTVIAEYGIEIKNSSNIRVEELILEAGSVGVNIDADSKNIAFKNCKISAEDAMVSSGKDITLQDCEIAASDCGIKSSGSYLIARNNKITAENIGIELTEGSYNSMAAQNIIKARRSVCLSSGFNCVVILNQAENIVCEKNTHLYVIKNTVSGDIELRDNTHLISDGNRIGGRAVNIGNIEFNGDNMHDVTTRLEYGAYEALLPHTDPDQYLRMERRVKITDLSGNVTENCGAYVRDAAAHGDVVIVPPGAYHSNSKILIEKEHSNTDFYLYGAFIEATYANDTVWNVDGAENISVNGLTLGHTHSTCGQIHIVAVDAENKTVTAIPSAGFVDGFYTLAPTPGTSDVGYNTGSGYIYKYHKPESGEILANAVYGGSGNITDISDSGDGTYNIKMSHVAYIEAGDVFATRLGARGQNAVRTDHANVVKYKDLTVFGVTNSSANRVKWSRGVTYERYHAARPNGYEITKETYDKYTELSKKYGVDLGVYYDEKHAMYRGPYPILGCSSSMEVEDSYEGTKLTCSILQSTCDDGSNQRGSSSRVAGMVNNGNGTYTVYFKGNQDTVHRGGFQSYAWMTERELCKTANIEKGNIIAAYTSDGHVLIKDAVALNDQVAGSPEGLHLAHTGEKYCDICGKKIYSDDDKFPESNTKYDNVTGRLSFEIPRGDKPGSEIITWQTTVYSVNIEAKYVNESLIDKYDFCFNGIDLDKRVILDNMSKNCMGIVFDNVYAHDLRSRALLAKTRDVTVKHSTFKNLYMQALVFGSEAEWSESTIARNVLIEHCVFDNCAATNEYGKRTLIYDDSKPGTVPIDIRGVGITFEDAISKIEPHAEMLASDFVIRHNKFINTKNKHMICVTGACDVSITDNIFEERAGDGETVYINGCYNVNVKDNKYTDRIKGFLDMKDAESVAAIYNCENVSVEDLDIPKKVTLKPSKK